MKIIGIDPGLRKTGWGVVNVEGNFISHISNGTLIPNSRDELCGRLLDIFQKLSEVIKKWVCWI